MVTKHQVINGVSNFLGNHMIPKAEGNLKIVLKTAKAGMRISPEGFWELIKNNSLVEMTGAVQEDHVDIELMAEILAEGFGEDEFNISFKLLGKEYSIYLSAEDIKTLKNCIERA
jgi:hypothetical protein